MTSAAFSWTFVQPASVGPYLVQVVLLHDDVVAIVAQSNLDVVAVDDAWRQIVRSVHAAAMDAA